MRIYPEKSRLTPEEEKRVDEAYNYVVNDKGVEPIQIFEEKWSTNETLVATWKVRDGINYLIFINQKNKAGIVFSFMGEDIRDCPIQNNGKGKVYCVPSDVLKIAR